MSRLLRLNVGSGQRKFGPFMEFTPHNLGCAFCGVSAELHGAEDPCYHPRIYDTPHKYVPHGSFVNIDINPRWEPDLLADCSSLPMLADGSCELIVSHHQLEHVDLTKADAMLAEWYRLLAPGGSLLVFVPDLRALADAWVNGKINNFIYCVNLYGAYMGDEADRHKWGYTFLSLMQKLQLASPWRLVKPFDWRKVEGADIAARDFWILAVEAIK